ncbi:hypothetical protein [Streptomyces sp. RPT161]|nr:hypothetical protein [Streptomyces sp. RPT161]
MRRTAHANSRTAVPAGTPSRARVVFGSPAGEDDGGPREGNGRTPC